MKGYFARDLGRAGNLAISGSTDAPPRWATNYAGTVNAQNPYRLDFVMEPAASIRGKLNDPLRRLPNHVTVHLAGDKLPPSSSVLASSGISTNGEFEFGEVPVGYTWWFELEVRDGSQSKTLRSPPLLIKAPAEKRLKLTVTRENIIAVEN
jgi:hypothetical protein